MTSLHDPYGVLGGAVLERAVCQKCGHEIAYDLHKFANEFFDESSIYCPPCRRSTVKLVPYICEEYDCDFVYSVWCYYCPECGKEGDGSYIWKDGSSPREPSMIL